MKYQYFMNVGNIGTTQLDKKISYKIQSKKKENSLSVVCVQMSALDGLLKLCDVVCFHR